MKQNVVIMILVCSSFLVACGGEPEPKRLSQTVIKRLEVRGDVAGLIGPEIERCFREEGAFFAGSSGGTDAVVIEVDGKALGWRKDKSYSSFNVGYAPTKMRFDFSINGKPRQSTYLEWPKDFPGRIKGGIPDYGRAIGQHLVGNLARNRKSRHAPVGQITSDGSYVVQ